MNCATKRPWKIREYTNFNGFVIESESDPLFGCITERWENLAIDSRRESMKANARLIVQAVNHHQELVDALVAITFAAKTENLEKNSVAWKNLLEDCVALLAKIKEG